MIITNPLTLINGGASGTDFLSPIVINGTNLTLTITPGSGILPAASDGVGGLALFDALEILWVNNSGLGALDFPLIKTTNEQFELVNGWTFTNDTTRRSLRSCGWVEKDGSDVTTRMYMGVTTLGYIKADDQLYYQWNDETEIDFPFTGAVNVGVQIYGDVSNGNIDWTGSGEVFKIFSTFQGKLYASSDYSAIDSLTFSPSNYRFMVSSQGGLTDNQAIMLSEIYSLYGLDPTKPLIVTENTREVGSIYQAIDNVSVSTTVTRLTGRN